MKLGIIRTMAALGALLGVGVLQGAPAASWLNFKGGITNQDGTISYYGSRAAYVAVVHGTPQEDGSVLLTEGGIEIALQVAQSKVSVMVDMSAPPESGDYDILAVKTSTYTMAARSKSRTLNLLYITNSNSSETDRTTDGGTAAWGTAEHRWVTMTHQNNANGTSIYLDDAVAKPNDSALRWDGQTVNTIKIGTAGQKIYAIHLYLDRLDQAGIASERAAIAAAQPAVINMGFTRRSISGAPNKMNYAVLKGGVAPTALSSFIATRGTNAANKSATSSDNTGNFFYSSWSGTDKLEWVKWGYPMVMNKFTNADTQYCWRVWLPVTLAEGETFNQVLPEIFPTTSTGTAQDPKAFTWTVKLYRYAANETSAPAEKLVATAAGTTPKSSGLNAQRVSFDEDRVVSITSENAGDYTVMLEVKPSDCGGGSYSGIRSLQFFNYTAAARTVSGAEGTWNTASEWTDSVAPITGTDVTLRVTDAATLSMDADASLSSLTVNDGSAEDVTPSLTFSGTNSLTSATTTLHVDTDVSAITANLGAVTVDSGKKLTVGANTSASSWGVGGTTVATKGDFAVPVGLWTMMKSSTEAERPTKLVVESGTLKLKDESASTFAIPIEVLATLDINGLHDSHPRLTLMNGAVLKNSGTARDWNKAQLKDIVLAGDAKVSGNTFGSIAGSWVRQSLTLGGYTLTVAMNEGNTFYLASAGARLSESDETSEAGTVKVTSGTLSLYSNNNADSLKRAKVVLAGGTLLVEGTGLLGSLAGESGTLDLSNQNVSIGDLNKDTPEDTTFAGAVLGTGTFRKVGTGTQTLSGDLSGFRGAYVIEAGKLILSTDGTLALPNTISGSSSGTGTLGKSGAGTLSLTGMVSTPVELAEGTLDLGTSRPAVTVTGTRTTLVLLQGLDDVADDVTRSPISLSFADGIESCTVVTKSLGGATKRLTILSSDVTTGTVRVTFPMETGTVNDTLPTAHRTCGFEDNTLTGLDTGGMQNMTFDNSPFPGQGKYGQIGNGNDGRPHSGDNNNNRFRTETGERGFTFSLKVRPNTCLNKGVLFSFGKKDNAVALLWQDDESDSTKGHFAVYSVLSTEGANASIVTSQLVTKDAWHAVSVVSSLETKRFYITVDGTMAKSEVLSNGLSIEDGVFQVGSVHTSVPSGWNNGDGAQVDDFRFDKVPLTQAQIARLLFHYAAVSDGDDSTLTGLTEFGSGTQVAWADLKATADARISVAEGVTATATLTAPTAATLKVWGEGTLEVAKGDSAQTIAAVELKEATTTLLLHRSQEEVVTSRVGTLGTFKFVGGTKDAPLVVPYNVNFPGAIAIAADSCVKLNRSISGNASYQVTGAGQSSIAIVANTEGWGVLDTDGSVTSRFRDLTLSIGGSSNFWIRAGLTDNVWLEIPTGRTVTQEADAPGTTDGVLTVRNLTGGGTFTTSKENKTLCLLNTEKTASEYSSGVTINTANSNKLVFAGKWVVPNAITPANYPATVEIGDGSTVTDVQLQATGNDRALTVAENATLEVATGTPTAEAMDRETAAKSFTNNRTLTNRGTLKLTSGYAYINVAGTGKTLVPAGSTFVFGIGGDNHTAPFTNDLTVDAEGDAKGELQLRTFNDATLTVPTLVLNGKLTKTKGRTPTIEVTGTGTLAAGSMLGEREGEGVALKVAEGATCTSAGPLIRYDANAKVTIDGEFSVTGSTEFYRQVVGEGKISVAEGKTLTIGRDRDTGSTGLVAGVSGFTGTLEVASSATLALPNYSSTADYPVDSCAVAVDGTLSGGASLTIPAGKTLSGTGTIAVPVALNGALGTGSSLTFEKLVEVAADATLSGAATFASGSTLKSLAAMTIPVTFEAGSTIEIVGESGFLQLSAKVTLPKTGVVKVKPAKSRALLLSVLGGLRESAFALDERVAADYSNYCLGTPLYDPSVPGDTQWLMLLQKPRVVEGVEASDEVLSAVARVVAEDYGWAITVSSADARGKAKLDGAALFGYVTALSSTTVEGSKVYVAQVSYDFGVDWLTVTADNRVVLRAKVASTAVPDVGGGSVPATILPGTTVKVQRKTTDAEGNPVWEDVASSVLTEDEIRALGQTPGNGVRYLAIARPSGVDTFSYRVVATSGE